MGARAYADERHAYFDEIRKELLSRHKATGETNLEGDGVVSILTKELMSDAWLEQLRDQHEGAAGGVHHRESQPVIDREKTGAWMARNNMPRGLRFFVALRHASAWKLAVRCQSDQTIDRVQNGPLVDQALFGL